MDHVLVRRLSGFAAHPYREYSEVFFGAQYRVLRGGSGRRTRASPPSPSATGTSPSAGRSSPASASPTIPRRADDPLLTTDAIVVESFVGPKDERSLADDVLDGLTRPFKELPPKHFYDARGAELFDQICELPEYYPTRAERAILEERSAEIVEATGAAELVELGSGTAAKTRLLLRAMAEAGTLRRYVPLDVTESMVLACADELVDEFPGLRVHGIVGDFERHLPHVPEPDGPASSPSWAAPSATSLLARGGASCEPSPSCCARASTICCWAPTSSRTRPCSRPPTTTARA